MARKPRKDRVPIEPGDRFGHVTVVRDLPRRQYKSGQTHRAIEVECDCGQRYGTEVRSLSQTTTCRDCRTKPNAVVDGKPLTELAAETGLTRRAVAYRVRAGAATTSEIANYQPRRSGPRRHDVQIGSTSGSYRIEREVGAVTWGGHQRRRFVASCRTCGRPKTGVLSDLRRRPCRCGTPQRGPKPVLVQGRTLEDLAGQIGITPTAMRARYRKSKKVEDLLRPKWVRRTEPASRANADQ